MKNHIHVGAVSPLSLIVDVRPSALLPDLSVVTAASLSVQKAGVTEAAWTCVIASQSATAIRVTHAFVAGELDRPGTYVVIVLLTTPDGVVPTKPRAFDVQAKYAVD